MSQFNYLYRPVGDDQCANLPSIELSQSTFEYQANEPPNTKHTYSSFPSPVSGRSPTLPSFRIPKYGYFGIDGPAGARSPTSSPVEFVRPGSSADERKNSVFGALIQSINYFMGIGVLTLPYALATTGWFGLVLLVVLGGIMTLTAWLFGGSRRKLYLENFSDHIELAFATRGKVVVSLIFYASMLINAGVFTKLLGGTLSSLTGYGTAPTMAITVLTFMLVTNLSTTSTAPLTRIMSVLGTLSTVLLILGLIVAEILALLRYEASLDSAESVYMHVWTYTATERVYITDMRACLQTLGVFGYCYMGHEVFPAIFHHMWHPQYFTFVVSIAFTSMLLCYATIATLGYLVYGVTALGNIIDNLPPTDILTVCIKVCIVVTVLAKLTLCAAPLSEGIHEWTRLLCYLATHWFCPGIRISSEHTHTVVLPVHTSRYGTYQALSPTHKSVSPYHNNSTLHRSEHTQNLPTLNTLHTITTLANHSALSPLTTQELDLNLASNRRKYFNTAYFDVEKEILAQHSFDIEENRLSGLYRLDETSQLLPTLPIGTTDTQILPPLYHDPSCATTPHTIGNNSYPPSKPPYPPVPQVPSVSTLNVTSPVHSHKDHSHKEHSQKELSWSEPLLIIPPIRSPPCSRVLSSSADDLAESMYMPHLTLGQTLVQQEGELVSEEEQSQSLGHSLSALTELLGSHPSSTRNTSNNTSNTTGTSLSIGYSTRANTTAAGTLTPLTLRKPEDCTALIGSTNTNNRNDIHSDSDSSSSLETIDMWYTRDTEVLVPVKNTTTTQSGAKTTTKDVTPRYTSFASPSNHTQLSSFAQYQLQLQEQQREQQQGPTIPHSITPIGRDCAADRILPVLIRCTIPLIALGLASLFDSFVSMVIFTGGVCGGSVSIVIPTYAYYNIHYRELYTVQKLLLAAVIVVGAAMVLATLIFATF